MRLVKKVGLVASLAGALFFLIAGSVQADFPVGPADDTMPSLGKFRIYVDPAFRPLMAGYPGYDGVSRLESPTLSEPATVVGRSAPHAEGSAPDIGGTVVGTGATIIADSSFSLVPPIFEGPPSPRREVHTEIVSLNLTALGGAVAVRAGPTHAPGQPISPGEVQSKDASGTPANDFPADSFFDVFVEVDLPAFAGFPGGTVYNSVPLLIIDDNLTDPPGFPPRVVYRHGNSSAVPVRFLVNNPPHWSAGDLFGFMVLAGHGASFGAGDTAEFEAIYYGLTEMPVPGVGGIAELGPLADTSGQQSGTPADGSGWSAGAYAALAGGLAAAAVVLTAGAWYGRKRILR